ncbi:hypothetical protein VTJ49DRAFT_912 [Mycothermus thermophilus]|uniref:Uncharacterized protein n=1 Tax=Humicola insolens TaxID=85995 RepID=A0ABR3VF44_HUMIN
MSVESNTCGICKAQPRYSAQYHYTQDTPVVLRPSPAQPLGISCPPREYTRSPFPIIHTTILQSPIPYSKPFSPRHRPTNHPPKQITRIEPTQNRNRPPLPVPVPIERDRHGTQPGTHNSADQSSERLIQRRRKAAESGPGAAVDATHKEEREQRESGHVRGAEQRVGAVRQEGRAEQDHSDVQKGCDEGGEQEGEDRRLFVSGWLAIKHKLSIEINERTRVGGTGKQRTERKHTVTPFPTPPSAAAPAFLLPLGSLPGVAVPVFFPAPAPAPAVPSPPSPPLLPATGKHTSAYATCSAVVTGSVVAISATGSATRARKRARKSAACRAGRACRAARASCVCFVWTGRSGGCCFSSLGGGGDGACGCGGCGDLLDLARAAVAAAPLASVEGMADV